MYFQGCLLISSSVGRVPLSMWFPDEGREAIFSLETRRILIFLGIELILSLLHKLKIML
jgi:hypothetical protein